MDDPWNLIQWPAMLVTLTAAWLVASDSAHRRSWGFWVFVASNLLWVAWGWHTQAYALIALQGALRAELARRPKGRGRQREGRWLKTTLVAFQTDDESR